MHGKRIGCQICYHSLYLRYDWGAKAVPLTHENVLSNFLGILDIIPISHTDASLSFLPLSHIFERTVGFVCVMGVGARIYYAESIDTVARDLLVAKPTFIISVPRLYEKIYQKVMGNASGAKKVILKLALAIGRNFSESNPLWKVAYKVVFSKIHEKTGGNVQLFSHRWGTYFCTYRNVF